MGVADIPDSAVKGDPKDMVVLYGWSTLDDTVSSLSPYVGKVEAYLRMNEIPYEVRLIKGDLRESPKAMAPYIRHGDVLLADSTFILDYLANTYADTLKVKSNTDPKLDGIAVAVQRLCEDNLYYSGLWSRWIPPKGWEKVRNLFFKGIPFPFSMFIPNRVRQSVVDKLHKQGLGRHSEKDILKLTDKTLSALSAIIGSNKFITGDKPCPEDAIVFSILDNILRTRFEDDPVKPLAQKYSNLTSYLDNFEKVYFPEANPSQFKVK